MRGDGKNAFYRTLNLDKSTRKLLRWYRNIYDEIINDNPIKKKQKPKCETNN